MIVSAEELSLILNPKVRRRLMRLPVLTGGSGESKRCPVRRGGSYRLRPPGSKDVQVTITVIAVPRLERLGSLPLADARREGYGSVRGALDAWEKAHWTPTYDEMVWVVAFARDHKGEVAAAIAQERPVYLATSGDYTLDISRAAKGEPEVLMPLEEDLKRARAKALEKRRNPQVDDLGRMRQRAETLRESMTNMKARELVRRAARNLAAAQRVLSEGVLDSQESCRPDGSAVEVDRPPTASSPASPEAA